jgi:hypothetical protein
MLPGFWIFKVLLCCIANVIFCAVKGEKYSRNNNKYWRLSFLIIPPIEFCKRQSIFENRQKLSILFFHFFAVLKYALPFTEFYRRNDENMQNWCPTVQALSLAFEIAESQWKYIFESRHNSYRTITIFETTKKFCKNSNIYSFSDILSPLSRRKWHWQWVSRGAF